MTFDSDIKCLEFKLFMNEAVKWPSSIISTSSLEQGKIKRQTPVMGYN
jgi:hypothetical protein